MPIIREGHIRDALQAEFGGITAVAFGPLIDMFTPHESEAELVQEAGAKCVRPRAEQTLPAPLGAGGGGIGRQGVAVDTRIRAGISVDVISQHQCILRAELMIEAGDEDVAIKLGTGVQREVVGTGDCAGLVGIGPEREDVFRYRVKDGDDAAGGVEGAAELPSALRGRGQGLLGIAAGDLQRPFNAAPNWFCRNFGRLEAKKLRASKASFRAYSKTLPRKRFVPARVESRMTPPAEWPSSAV